MKIRALQTLLNQKLLLKGAHVTVFIQTKKAIGIVLETCLTKSTDMKFVIRFTLLAVASFILQTASAQTAADPAAFEQFLQQFPKAQLPCVIGTTELSAQLEQRAQGVAPVKASFLSADSYDFLPDLERSAETTQIPAHPQPVARFETATHHAVVYNVSRSAAKQYRALYVAVYDKQGNYVSTTLVAGVNPNALVSAVIDEQLHVKIQEFRVEWAKDPKAGIVGNQLTGLTPMNTQGFDLTSAEPATDWNDRHEPKTSASADLARNDSK